MTSHDLRSFGRRRGRKPSPRQECLLRDFLPRVRIEIAETPFRPEGIFSPPAQSVWLEIGFGGGEHLLWQAARHPAIGFIGCEPFQDGVVKVLSAIADEARANIRLYPEDARGLLRALAPQCIDRAFVLFPDPWPKQRHVKRRLLSEETLDLLARVLKVGAELRVATDIGDYARTLLLAVRHQGDFVWTAREPQDWRTRPHDWPPTRYEAKALRESRRPYYLRFQRR